MKRLIVPGIILLTVVLLAFTSNDKSKKGFVKVEGQNLVMPDGKMLHIKGTNLGNWLNAEGYLLGLKNSASSYRQMDEAFREMVGEAFTDQFWRNFQQQYVTKEDISFIAKTGMNTIRLPFHYKLLTNEPFMGYASKQHGYALLDSVIGWCKDAGLYVILDMHVAPGGQTGMNIDDSYGYPWLFETDQHKQQFCDIWKELAKHFVSNTTVLAYDVINEPIASSFFKNDTARLNKQLDSLLRRVTKVIRTVDKNHIVMLSGSQWGNDYSIFTDWKFDNNIMFTCHRYHCDTTEAGIKDFLDYRTKFNLPFYMGETGHEPDQWIAGFRRLLERVNIGWTYWPYKKMRKDAKQNGMVYMEEPANWQLVVDYAESDRRSFELIRKNRPNPELARAAFNGLIQQITFRNCIRDEGYIKSLGMMP